MNGAREEAPKKEQGKMTADMIKIGIPGAAGRMGGMIIREIARHDDMVLVAATDRPGSDAYRAG
jgi:predicted homoserine dehydrogenase-like protein